MPKYKITYFNVKARGELARLVLTAAGVEFEDNRVDSDKWKELKAGNILNFYVVYNLNSDL